MAMVTTGPISLGGNATSGGLNQSVNIELGRAATATINMNESAVRNLAGVASGAISMNNFYGKSTGFTFNRTISTNIQNYNLLNDMVANGYTNGSAFTANITINSGVYVWSNDTSLAGFDTGNITGTGAINIVNNGFIIGRGGMGGGTVNTSVTIGTGTAGGPAMNILRPVNINNNSFIAGGGGGGASRTGVFGGPNIVAYVNGGGGAGGGGIQPTGQFGAFWSPGVADGGAPGQAGPRGPATSGVTPLIPFNTGGTGGRILPGTGGTRINTPAANALGGLGGSANSVGGDGTVGAYVTSSGQFGGGGGSGGCGSGGSGTTKSGNANLGGGGGGGWGASGGAYNGRVTNTQFAVFGGNNPGLLGGRAINTNGNTVTFIATGTVYGAVA
jgi:hypothetical protein